MGRGLSYLQERILVYARDRGHPPEPWYGDHFGDFNHVAPWLDGLSERGKITLEQKLFPSGLANPAYPQPRQEERSWGPATIVAVSRALRRLEARGLIVRFPRRPDLRDILLIQSSGGLVQRVVSGSRADRVRPRTHGIALTAAGQAIAATLPE
jgi:hypothetical protein